MSKKKITPSSPKADSLKRRSFLKKFGMGVVMASTFSVISLTQFACVHDPQEEAVPKGGY